MDQKIVTNAKTFTDDPEFDPEVVAKKGSAAAAGLAKWVHAMVCQLNFFSWRFNVLCDVV